MYCLVQSYTLKKFKGEKNKKILKDMESVAFIEGVSIEKNENQFILVVDYKFDSEKEKNKKINSTQKALLKIIQKYEKKASFDIVVNEEKFRKVLYLRGLDCAHCAARIESLAKRQFNNEQIIVDFATCRFIIETNDKELLEDLIPEVTNVAHRVDPRIIVQDADVAKKERQSGEEKKKTDWPFIIISLLGAISFLIGVIIERQTVLEHIMGNEGEMEFFWNAYGIPGTICFILAYILLSYKVLGKFFRNLFSGHFLDENLLMTLATIGAIINSYYSEAIMIMVLFQLGEFIQEHAVNQSRKSISKLLTIDVKKTRMKVNNEIVDVDVESVIPGDIIYVNKGEMIPLDGILLSPRASLDTKNITGESLRRNVKVKEEVCAGSINMSNVIEIKVTKLYTDSMITKILDSVENASAIKAKSEKFITKFSKIYTPVVVGVAVSIALFGFVLCYFVFRHGFDDAISWVYRATIFLVISCPCALVISIPLSYFCGIGVASSQGILIKGSNYLESLNNTKEIVFDKTGTITKGEFSITEIVLKNDKITEKDMIKYVVYTEYYSTHPIGVALVDNFGRSDVFTEIISDFEDIESRGAKATINNNRITIGNYLLMSEMGLNINEVKANGLVIHVAKNKEYMGYVVVGDKVKENASETILHLRKHNIDRIALLTGDNHIIGEYVGNMIGADEIYCGLLPDQKVLKLQELKKSQTSKNGRVVYVGDGLNDAPVIASSDIGVAMGSNASDATIEIADVVIMNENLSKVDDLILIAKKTRRKVVQNIVFCLVVKSIIMILSVIPTIIVPVWLAVFADVGVSLIAIFNSMTLMQVFKKREKLEKIQGTENETQE